MTHKAALPDGGEGFEVNHCPEMRHCTARATELCGGPFEIVSQSDSLRSGITILVKCKAK